MTRVAFLFIHSPVGTHLYVRTSDVFGHLHLLTLPEPHLHASTLLTLPHVNFDMVSIDLCAEECYSTCTHIV